MSLSPPDCGLFESRDHLLSCRYNHASVLLSSSVCLLSWMNERKKEWMNKVAEFHLISWDQAIWGHFIYFFHMIFVAVLLWNFETFFVFCCNFFIVVFCRINHLEDLHSYFDGLCDASKYKLQTFRSLSTVGKLQLTLLLVNDLERFKWFQNPASQCLREHSSYTRSSQNNSIGYKRWSDSISISN